MTEAPPVFGRRLPGVTYVDRPGAYAFLWNEARDRLGLVETSFGLFLPGGGLDPGEDPVTGLARELREEIGYVLSEATYVTRAEQYHWSEFYRTHFRKIGSFYRVEATAPAVPTFQAEHGLVWLSRDEAARRLAQEFQRWAVTSPGVE